MPSKRNTPQNVRDFAVVIGIKDYPGFEKPGPLAPAPLLGPENDARAFYDWLICSDGGGLPEENVKLIVSSLFRPPFPNVKKARPVITEVQEAFEDLQDIADENRKRREGWQVGRRLYIYMSGHGFAPKSDDNETALLMANATADRVGPIYHLLGKYTADWFYKVRFFEEVLLFMDCCRNLLPVQGLNRSFTDKQSPDRMSVKRFFALATRSSGLAKEMDYDGIRRGVFTYNFLFRVITIY